MEKKFKISITGDDGYLFERNVTKDEADGIILQIVSGKPNGQSFSVNPPNDIAEDNSFTKQHRRSNSKKRILPKVEIRDSISALTLDPTSPDYGDYWKLPSKGARILWLLAVAKQNGIDGVYQKEITAMSSKLGDHIETKAITALIISHRKASRLVDSPDQKGIKTIRILHLGEEFLKGLIVKGK
jgi:hypothetical protein